MRKQTQYFINGIILLILGLLVITITPLIIENYRPISLEKYMYSEIEFFMLMACGVYYLFSPKYYKYQIISIALGMTYYFVFVHVMGF